jgi:flavin reductase (DIM6/NTAB) family NADH-FMN oxidoreductase RutF
MRRIWNRPDFAVWSLSTIDAAGQGNFNICTYVSSISMRPKLVMIAIYHHTKTLENLKQHPTAILQLLTDEHADIVKVCGKQSGHAVNKLASVTKKHPLKTIDTVSYLADCAGYMQLEFTDFIEVGGDHVLGVATVIGSQNLSDTPLLTTDVLKAKKIIR